MTLIYRGYIKKFKEHEKYLLNKGYYWNEKCIKIRLYKAIDRIIEEREKLKNNNLIEIKHENVGKIEDFEYIYFLIEDNIISWDYTIYSEYANIPIIKLDRILKMKKLL